MAEDKSESTANGAGEGGGDNAASQDSSPTSNDRKNEDSPVKEAKKIEDSAGSPVKAKPANAVVDEEAAKAKENGEGGDSKPKENGEKSQPEQPQPKDMRAIALSSYGGVSRVKAVRKPEPAPAEGEVLVRVRACGLNFQDLMARQGALDSFPKPPCILGFECAGDIEQVGEGVDNFSVGDKVVALPDSKAWAEYVSVPATSVFKLPQGMSYQDAVAVTMNYTVAYILLFELANLSPGKSILLHSAGGGVGQAIVQLAKTVENTTIFGVCSKSKHEALKESGLIHHLLERGTDYSSLVKKESPDGVDVVFDCMYGDDCRKGYALLKPMGRYILYGLSNAGESKSLSAARFWWQVNKVPPIKLFEENKTMCGFNLRHLMYQKGGNNHGFVQKCVDQVFKMWSEGKIKPVVDSVWALEDVAEAMQKMHEHKNIGKIVLDPNMEPKPKPVTPAKNKSKDKKNAIQEDKKASSIDSEDGDKKKDAELTNGNAEEKSDSDSKEKESS